MANDAVPAREGDGRPALAFPQLEFYGNLEIAHDGETVQLRADGSRITLDATSLKVLRELTTAIPFPLTGLDAALTQQQLHVEVRVKGNVVARLEPGEDPHWMASLAGIPGATVSLSGLLRAMFGQRGPGGD